MINQYINQSSIIQPYSSAPCDDMNIISTIPCQYGDGAYSIKTCLGSHGPIQYNCTKVDSNICPKIGDIDNIAYFESHPKVKCTYNVDTFKNSNDINIWMSNWGKDSNYSNTIMPNYCMKVTDNCPIHPLTNTKLSNCTKFISLSNDKSLCNEWASENPSLYNTTISEICLNNNSVECLCENRYQDPLYIDIKTYLNPNISDIHWWKPCTQSDFYLINTNNKSIDTNLPDISDDINKIIQTYKLDKKYSINELMNKIKYTIKKNNIWTPAIIIWTIISIIIIFLVIFFIIYLLNK